MPHIAANVMTFSLFRFGTNFPSTLNDCGLGQFNFEFWRQAAGKTMNKVNSYFYSFYSKLNTTFLEKYKIYLKFSEF